ncbi:MAG: hypothetical protein WCE68_14365 [Anaerolineales bacterium]
MLDHSQFVICPHCRSTVLPLQDHTCPSCRERISAPKGQGQAELDLLEDQNVKIINSEREPQSESPMEGTDLKEKPEDEAHGGISKGVQDFDEIDIYKKYWQAAWRITRKFWITLGIWFGFAGLFLIIACIFSVEKVAQGENTAAWLGFGLGLGLAVILVSLGCMLAGQASEIQAENATFSLPGFILFYDLYRPHLRNTFWAKQPDDTTAATFMRIFHELKE